MFLALGAATVGTFRRVGEALLQLADAGVFKFGARAILTSPADGQVRVTDSTGTAGAILDVLTDGKFTLRNRTDTADAHLQIDTLKAVAVALSAGPGMFAGAGSPEGAVAAAVGSVYYRSDGAAGTALYVKESGAGNTGWVPYSAATADTWHVIGAGGEPGFLNGWSDAGATWSTPAFILRAGVVHLRGTVTGGTVRTAIFQMPAAYRPAKETNCIVSYYNGSAWGACNLYMKADGTPNVDVGAATYVNLTGVSFVAGG